MSAEIITTDNLDWDRYRDGTVDFGCSSGGSIGWAKLRLGGDAFGIDIDDEKLAQTRAAGHAAHRIDLFDAPLPAQRVRHVTMFHVLEHLFSERQTVAFLRQAVRVARGAVLMRGPNFDHDTALAQMGLKFYYADWSGHTNHLTGAQLFKLSRRVRSNRVLDISIYGGYRVTGQTHALVPLDAPVNTSLVAAQARYPSVNADALGLRLFSETAMILRLAGDDCESLEFYERALKLRREDRLIHHVGP